MFNKYLISLGIISALVITTGAVSAYPSDALFGGGYSGVRQIENQAQYADAVNSYGDKINATAKETAKEAKKTYTETEKNISNVVGNPYANPTDKDYDYNPYVGADSGVNDTKTIYTDGLGRMHFFGKNNRVKH